MGTASAHGTVARHHIHETTRSHCWPRSFLSTQRLGDKQVLVGAILLHDRTGASAEHLLNLYFTDHPLFEFECIPEDPRPDPSSPLSLPDHWPKVTVAQTLAKAPGQQTQHDPTLGPI